VLAGPVHHHHVPAALIGHEQQTPSAHTPRSNQAHWADRPVAVPRAATAAIRHRSEAVRASHHRSEVEA
jgi:hypothetical protein